MGEQERRGRALFQQGEVWVDRADVEHRIAEMEPGYCRNVISFLHRRAQRIAMLAWIGYASVELPDEDTVAHMRVTGEMDRMVTDPVGWLDTLPLLEALARRAAEG